MGKKGKKKQVVNVDNNEQEKGHDLGSSDDEGPTPLKKRMRPVSSDSEDEEPSIPNREMRKRKVANETATQSSKKKKILRCVDSSDEENVENSAVSTPKAERMNKLQEMRKKIQAKKKVVYDSSNEDSSEDDKEWLEEDEDSLPVWKNEEAPPEEKWEESDNDDLVDFIVDDEEPEEQGNEEVIGTNKVRRKKKGKLIQEKQDHDAGDLSEAEEQLAKDRKSKKDKSTKSKSKSSKKVEDTESSEDEGEELESESEDDGEELKSESEELSDQTQSKKRRKSKPNNSDTDEDEVGTDSSEDETDYANPYMQMDREMEDTNILDVLSKNTDKDKKNAKKYKKEMGKYQYAVHSDKNRAAQVSKKARFAKNMESAKFDKGFKADRNLDIKDSEYYDYVETSLYGEGVRIFPHTKRVSKYTNRCALRGCGEPFAIGTTKIIGMTKFCDINFQYMKKLNNFGKESFYYVCGHHLPKTGSDSEEYTSGED
eukprot:GFUD01007587.1.p1 GENE.GFUD01007587.1~~GFUD01007587.1.p1  ORF type:complete len:484 (+),score=171.39 GFUD01007587.1:39-1490(+)